MFTPTPCGTPGSAPQLPITLMHSMTDERQLYLELASRQADLGARVMHIILVPGKGPIAVAQTASGRLSREREQRVDGITQYSVAVTMSKPRRERYRVLLEERDLAAPTNCPLEFFEDLGTVDVAT